jgi:hypothetical protein
MCRAQHGGSWVLAGVLALLGGLTSYRRWRRMFNLCYTHRNGAEGE